jgi:hypothetical protein
MFHPVFACASLCNYVRPVLKQGCQMIHLHTKNPTLGIFRVKFGNPVLKSISSCKHATKTVPSLIGV